VPKVQADVTKPTQSGAKSTVSAAKQIAKEQSSALQAVSSRAALHFDAPTNESTKH
jgi:hypothetical protein